MQRKGKLSEHQKGTSSPTTYRSAAVGVGQVVQARGEDELPLGTADARRLVVHNAQLKVQDLAGCACPRGKRTEDTHYQFQNSRFESISILVRVTQLSNGKPAKMTASAHQSCSSKTRDAYRGRRPLWQ